MSPALAGRFSTTAPPGKPQPVIFTASSSTFLSETGFLSFLLSGPWWGTQWQQPRPVVVPWFVLWHQQFHWPLLLHHECMCHSEKGKVIMKIVLILQNPKTLEGPPGAWGPHLRTAAVKTVWNSCSIQHHLYLLSFYLYLMSLLTPYSEEQFRLKMWLWRYHITLRMEAICMRIKCSYC